MLLHTYSLLSTNLCDRLIYIIPRIEKNSTDAKNDKYLIAFQVEWIKCVVLKQRRVLLLGCCPSMGLSSSPGVSWSVSLLLRLSKHTCYRIHMGCGTAFIHSHHMQNFSLSGLALPLSCTSCHFHSAPMQVKLIHNPWRFLNGAIEISLI